MEDIDSSFGGVSCKNLLGSNLQCIASNDSTTASGSFQNILEDTTFEKLETSKALNDPKCKVEIFDKTTRQEDPALFL